MKPEEAEFLLERLAAAPAPDHLRERFLADAARRLAEPAGAARVSRGGWVAVAASLLVAIGVMWTSFSPDRAPAGDAGDEALPPGAVLRLGTVRFRHPGLIHAIALSPDGKTLASGGSGRSPLRLWDAASGRPLREPAGRPDSVYALAFSPDGRTVLSGGMMGILRLWQVETGHEVRRLTGHEDEIACVAVSPDGKTAASGGKDATVRVWDLTAGAELLVIQGAKPGIRALAFSPDGRALAWGNGDKTVRLCEIPGGKETARLEGHAGVIRSLAFAPDGKTLASAGYDRTIRIWNAETRKEIFKLEGHTGDLAALAYSPDGRTLASQSADQTIRLWDPATGRERRVLTGLNRFPNVYPFGPTLLFSADGATLIAGDACAIRSWDVDSGREVIRGAGHLADVVSVAFQPRGRLLASLGRDRTIRLWDVETGLETSTLAWPLPGHPLSLAISPDGTLLSVTGGVSGAVIVWDLATGQERFRLTSQIVPRSVAFSPDGRFLAVVNARQLVLWDVATGAEVRRLDAGEDAPLAFSPDGKALASSVRGEVRLWEVGTGRLLWSAAAASPECLAFSPDGRTLVSGEESGTLRFRDAATGAPGASLETGTKLDAAAFSPDGTLLALAGSDGVRVRDVAARKDLFRLDGHRWGVHSIAFSPDGRRLASGSGDSTILIWDVEALRR